MQVSSGRDDSGAVVSDVVMTIARSLVDHPDEVDVDIFKTHSRLIVELKTNRDDVGQMVGRRGRVIESIRCILGAIAGKNAVNVELYFVTEQQKRVEFKTAAVG